MKSFHSLLLALLLAVLAPAAGAQGQVLVVGPAGSGADYSDVQAAIDAASDGDTILIKPHDYDQGFKVSGKSLALVGDGGPPPTFRQPSSVEALAAGQSVLLAGLALDTSKDWFPALYLSGNAGRVRVEDCSATSTYGGVSVSQCDSVALLRVKVQGGKGLFSTNGALGVSASRVVAYGCELRGGDGETMPGCGLFCSTAAGSGLPGVGLDSGALLDIHGSDVRGGDGGDVTAFCCSGGCHSVAGDGGAGISAYDAASQAVVLDCVMTGGAPGVALGCSVGSLGQPFDGLGTFVTLSGDSTGLSTDSPARVGQQLAVELAGPPGLPAFLLLGPTHADKAVPMTLGVLLVGGAGPPLALGAIPPDGRISLSIPIPFLGGFPSTVVFGQAVHVESGLAVLGSSAAAVLLDSAF